MAAVAELAVVVAVAVVASVAELAVVAAVVVKVRLTISMYRFRSFGPSLLCVDAEQTSVKKSNAGHANNNNKRPLTPKCMPHAGYTSSTPKSSLMQGTLVALQRACLMQGKLVALLRACLMQGTLVAL